MTEYDKMLSGEIYNAVDPSLLKDLYACSELCWEYNQIRPTDFKSRNEKLKQILGEADDDTFINPPFHCDYGKHIKVGRRFFANFNFVVLDEAPVTIGDDVFIGTWSKYANEREYQMAGTPKKQLNVELRVKQ